MNDGEHHSALKNAVGSTLNGLVESDIVPLAEGWAERLSERLMPDDGAHGLSDFCFQLSGYVVGGLLGVPEERLGQTVAWVSRYVAGVAPTATADRLMEAKAAAQSLLDQFRAALTSPQSGGLLMTLAAHMHRHGTGTADAIAANGIGFLSQAYEATAGLIGNTVVRLASDPALCQEMRAYPDHLDPLVREVLRFDSPIQNTRRFVAQSGDIAGQRMEVGDKILVVLASANHDEAVNPQPERFDLFRGARQIFTFGIGAHACPGERLATQIAVAGVKRLLMKPDLPWVRYADVRYRASGNARIPSFV